MSTLDLPALQTLGIAAAGEHTLLVTLNRPEVGNAINTRMGEELAALWLELTAHPRHWRCVVLTGAGERIFCGGGDLKERHGMTQEQWQHQHEIFERAYWAMVDMPLPLIGAVNGHAYGGGLEIVLCCDFAYAKEGSRFALTEVTRGIMPGGGGTQQLPRTIGARRAKEVIFTGEPFSAEQALEWGIVNRLCPEGTVLDQAMATARRIAANAPISIRQAKKSIDFGLGADLRTGMQMEIEAYYQLIPTEDRREGISAFNEKRTPVFKGR